MSDRLQNCLYLGFKSTTLETFNFIPVVWEAKLKIFPIFYLDFQFISMISFIFTFEFQKIIVLLSISKAAPIPFNENWPSILTKNTVVAL